MKQYYDAHLDDYTKPEQVHARHILLKLDPDADDAFKAEVRKKAEEILAKVKAGEDFAALAKQYSEDSSAADGGDLGTFGRGKMVKPFEDAAFALAPGATSEIVESPVRVAHHQGRVEGGSGHQTTRRGARRCRCGGEEDQGTRAGAHPRHHRPGQGRGRRIPGVGRGSRRPHRGVAAAVCDRTRR